MVVHLSYKYSLSNINENMTRKEMFYCYDKQRHNALQYGLYGILIKENCGDAFFKLLLFLNIFLLSSPFMDNGRNRAFHAIPLHCTDGSPRHFQWEVLALRKGSFPPLSACLSRCAHQMTGLHGFAVEFSALTDIIFSWSLCIGCLVFHCKSRCLAGFVFLLLKEFF